MIFFFFFWMLHWIYAYISNFYGLQKHKRKHSNFSHTLLKRTASNYRKCWYYKGYCAAFSFHWDIYYLPTVDLIAVTAVLCTENVNLTVNSVLPVKNVLKSFFRYLGITGFISSQMPIVKCQIISYFAFLKNIKLRQNSSCVF